jgi:hypothetical protein
VSPNGTPTAQLSMRLPESDMIKVMLTIADYIHAYEAAHHHRIVADRVRELRDKLNERAERFEAAREVPAAAAGRAAQAGGATLTAIPGGARQTVPQPNTAARQPVRLNAVRTEKAV